MRHFGILCLAETGHLNPMLALAYELQQRGHAVTVFQVPDAEQIVLSAGFNYYPIGRSHFPQGTMPRIATFRGKLSGLAGSLYSARLLWQVAAMTLQELPHAIRIAGVDALLVDQASLAGGTVADHIGIPFISVCGALMFNQEVGVPPCFTHWQYQSTRWAYLRNRCLYQISAWIEHPIRTLINRYRQRWRLPLYTASNDYYSRLAQVCQQPAEFEFPRANLPACFHFTGPYTVQVIRESVPFPFEQLTEKPLIYASLGTLQNRFVWVFHRIAEACADMDAQLVISLGGALDRDALPQLPGSPIVVNYAPQLELLQRAALTITHAGLNTTLESLSNGVPMVAIPITNDQPGVAARIAWTETGEVVPLHRLSSRSLKFAVQKVLSETSYSANAMKLKDAIRRAGGVSRAADIIEQVIQRGIHPGHSTDVAEAADNQAIRFSLKSP